MSLFKSDKFYFLKILFIGFIIAAIYLLQLKPEHILKVLGSHQVIDELVDQTTQDLKQKGTDLVKEYVDSSSSTQPNSSNEGDTFLVIRVIDGDTIELESGQKVRYIGIDTPETKHPTKGQECFGQQASDYNQELVLNKNVRLEKDVSETDRYGRLLRYVWVDDILINEKLVAEGYAVASSYPPDVKRQEQFTQAEQEARENDRGLWGECEL